MRTGSGGLVGVLGLCAGLAVGARAAHASGEALSGAQLFVRHCARCHTTSGGGLPAGHPLLANFKVPPADFTDPLFNSRERAADWFLVVKHGGASMGLSSQMPAQAGRMSDADIERVVAQLAGFADTAGYPPGELNFTRPVRTVKAFPEDELLFLERYESAEAGDPAGWRSTLYYARRLGRRFQAEAKLSYLDQAPTSELHEAELGVKWAFHDRGTSLLLAGGIDAEIPLHAAGETTFVPYLSHASPLGGRFSLQGTLRAHLPSDQVSAGDVELSEVVHWMTTDWRRGLFPGLEVTLAMPFEGDAEWRASVIPQLHFALSKRGHVALNLGVELPLAGARDEYRYRVHAFLLWDIPDGSFWRGW
jgi:mono/diheme cytochrome c family protein